MSEDKEDRKAMKKRDAEFLTRAIIYAILLLGIFYAFLPYITPAGKTLEPSDQDVTALASEVKLLPASDIMKQMGVGDKPIMVIGYASWCSYCKLVMPSIHRLWKAGKFKDMQMVFISLDNNRYTLAKYILSYDLQQMIGQPVIVKASVSPSLPVLLQARGSEFTGGIPYVGFYNTAGNPVYELTGYFRQSSLEEAISLIHQ